MVYQPSYLEAEASTTANPNPNSSPSDSLSTREFQFRQLVENTNCMISEVTPDGRFAYVSPAFETNMGYTRDELQGQSFIPLIYSDDVPHCMLSLQTVIDTKNSVSNLEYRVFCQDGTIRWHSANLAGVWDEQGQLITLMVISYDITDRKTVEAALAESEVKFRRLIEDANDVIAIWDVDSVLTYISPGFQRILGHEPTEWIGKSFEPLVHPDDISHCWAFNKKALETGEKQSGMEFRHKHFEGHWLWISLSISPIKDNYGNVIAFQGMLRDINERKEAEQQLRDYADRQTLLNQLANQIRNSLDLDLVIANTIQAIQAFLKIDACAFAWYDPQTEPPTWNLIQEAKSSAMPSSIGSYPATLVGMDVQVLLEQSILQIDDVSQYSEPIHRAFLEMIQCKSELLLPIKTSSDKIGTIICTQSQHIRPWAAEEIELLKAVVDQLAIAIDQAGLYAESQAQSQQLQQTLEELKCAQSRMVQSEKMSSLGQLVAGIAHEINNPVNFIHGNVQHSASYLQDLLDLLDLYQQEYPQTTPVLADKIEEIDLAFLREDLPKSMASMQIGTERIREIVKSLRLFSRLDEAEVKSINIHEGLDSTLMILQNRIKKTSDRPDIQIIQDYGDLPLVECFAGQLNQVFMNILSNALDAIEEAIRQSNQQQSCQAQPPISGSIWIKTEVIPDNQIAIRIRDSGIGIPKEIQSQIFNPFFTTKEVGKGTGMGMSISYQIITEKHGGQLLCNSTLGEGTEFIIQIPIQQEES
jgi:two-component system, NtrC family, sensor kinase